MLQKAVSVGPPLQDLASWNSSKPGRNEESKESFESTLAENMNVREPVETRKVQSQDDKVSRETETPDEPIRVKKETPLEKKASLARQKAIEKFMDSFESEFGIAPTRLVEAMATLPAEELNSNPEQTVDSVLAQLDLSEEQEDQAKQMYLTLLSDLTRIDQAAATPKLMPATPAPMFPTHTKERFMAAQEKKSVLNRSLDQLNDRFWLRSAPPAVPVHTDEDMAPTRTNVDPWIQEEMAENLDMRQSLMVDDLGMPLKPERPTPGVVIPDEFETLENEVPAQDLPLVPVPMRSQSQPQSALMEKMRQAMRAEEQSILKPREQIPFSPPSALTRTIAAQKALHAALKESPAYQMALADSEDMETEESVENWNQIDPQADVTGMKTEGPLPTDLPMEKAVLGMSPKGQQMQSEKFQFDQQVDPKMDPKMAVKTSFKKTLDSLDSLPHPSLQRAETLNSSAPLEAAPAFTVRGPADNDANIRQIMNQAQYLIKKGGGEMKVEMSPEGLGALQMKVVVNDGRVNLQMATESKEAKQVIESSLSDLKSTLAAHKLSVDQVKVDVVGSTNTENSAQNSQSQQQPRDNGTRQFWQQFQENFGNRSQRDGYFELPAAKGYAPKKRDPLAPIESESRVSRKAEGKGNGLDLVA